MSRAAPDTRSALIEAGTALFAEQGYRATSVRAIAAAAGANVAAVGYHFGSKTGLYEAVVDTIAAGVEDKLGALTRQVQARLDAGDVSAHEAPALLRRLLTEKLDALISDPRADQWSLIIMREQFHPTGAFDRVFDAVMAPLHRAVTGLIHVARHGRDDSETDIIRAHALIGQGLGFLFSRETVLRRLGVRRLTDAHKDIMRGVIGDHVSRIVGETGAHTR
ncbi:CerR family C-terminal domain-containing protein [Yunchengibacter salinarum]|uniref:CerR family C-terminal domain-containing protein n=1 Tax=Yunchengibacter salinarum TaxID=3133399 RepID=UPI0035B58073